MATPTHIFVFLIVLVALSGESMAQEQDDQIDSAILKCLEVKEDPSQGDIVITTPTDDLYTIDLEHICRDPASVLMCMNIAARNSLKPADQLLQQLILPANTRAIMKHVCSNRKVIEKHYRCVMTSMMTQLMDNETCLRDIWPEVLDMTDYLFATESQGEFNVTSFCSHMSPLPNCLSSVTKVCCGKLAEVVKTLTAMAAKACGNPGLAQFTSRAPEMTSRLTLVLFSGLALLLAYIMR